MDDTDTIINAYFCHFNAFSGNKTSGNSYLLATEHTFEKMAKCLPLITICLYFSCKLSLSPCVTILKHFL